MKTNDDRPRTDERQRPNHKKKHHYLLCAGLTFVVCFFLAIAGLLAYLSFYQLKPTDSPPPIQFFVTSMVSLLVLLAVVAQAVIYTFQWIEMNKVVRQNERIIRASQRQANAAEQVMKIAHRPWLRVDVRITSALCFQGESASLSFGLVFNNFGTIAANNVQYRVSATFVPLSDYVGGPRKIQKELITQMKEARGVIPPALAVLPGHPEYQEVVCMFGAKLEQFHDIKTLGSLIVVGVIEYEGVWKDVYSQTSFIKNIYRLSADRHPLIIGTPNDIPANQLVLKEPIVGGSFAR